MSIYCVSDIHGRYDLFIEGLNKINFNHKKDKLYILGDVCNVGSNTLDLYDYIVKHNDNIKLIKGNHEYNFLEVIKAFKEVRQYPEVLEILKEYVNVYVSGFEKAQGYSKYKLNKWLTTDRRKNSLLLYNKYMQLCKKKGLKHYYNLVWGYERYFKIRKLMVELVNNPYRDFDQIEDYINNSPLIDTIQVNGKQWVMYHSQYSDITYKDGECLNYMNISRLKKSYESRGVNYIYGHTPIPQAHGSFTEEVLDYHKILKAVDYRDNKYYNIDVSHYGMCFLNLETLEEIYIGKHTDKTDNHETFYLDNYEIENITERYSKIKNYIIKKNGYFFVLVQYCNKLLSFYEYCDVFGKNENKESIELTTAPSMQQILVLFTEILKKKNKN